MYFKDFMNKYNGKYIDYDGYYGNQCTDLFRQFNKEVLGIAQPRGVNGAKDFWNNYSNDANLYNNFTKIANTPTFVPQEGDVAVWGNGTYGHIAICTGVGNVNKFESFDQNYPTDSKCHIVSHNYFNGFYGVLRPKDQAKIKDVTPVTPTHTKYNVLVTADVLNVRRDPSTKNPKKLFNELTKNAQAQILAKTGRKVNGLVKGVECTIMETQGNWGRIPSGWICLDWTKRI